MEKKTKKIFLIISLVFFLALLFSVIWIYSLIKSVEINEVKGINLTKEGFGNYLEEHLLIKELPENSDISLKLNGYSYSLSQGVVEESPNSEVDLEISIPEDLIEKIGEEGLCSVMGEGLDSGEIEVETELSESELVWKYRDVLKYRECFGSQ